MLKLYFLLFLFPFYCFSLQWEESHQECSVRCEIPNTTVANDELFLVKVDASFPEGMEFDVPAFIEGIWVSNGGLDLVSDSVQIEENTLSIKLQFDPWALGNGSLVFSKFLFKGKKSVEFFSDVFSFKVIPPRTLDPLETLSLSLLKPNEPNFFSLNTVNEKAFERLQEKHFENQKENYFPSKHLLSWAWILALTLLCVLCTGLYFLRKLTQVKKAEKAIYRDPSKKAKEALKLLLEEKLPEKGLINRYFTELTLICRTYIEEGFHIQAPEQTTEEFFQELSSCEIFSESFKNKVRSFLECADLVKFAKYSSSLSECHEAFQAAEELVYSHRKEPE